jgi:hypothetical protein
MMDESASKHRLVRGINLLCSKGRRTCITGMLSTLLVQQKGHAAFVVLMRCWCVSVTLIFTGLHPCSNKCDFFGSFAHAVVISSMSFLLFYFYN